MAPLLTSMGPILVLLACMFIQFSPGAFGVYMGLGMSLITLVNPITTLLLIRPLRRAARKVLREIPDAARAMCGHKRARVNDYSAALNSGTATSSTATATVSTQT